MTKEKLFSVGDMFTPENTGNNIQNLTIVEIIQLPKDPKKLRRLIKKISKRIAQTDEGIISGKNLADNPKLAPLVDENALYIYK